MPKDESFLINMYAMHHDPNQWIDPSKFIPERFDSKSLFFKRPNGEPRHSMTFNPFLGGKRGCIGKTFAETIVRFTLPILLYHLDFQLADPAMRAKKPQLSTSNLANPKVKINVTSKVKV